MVSRTESRCSSWLTKADLLGARKEIFGDLFGSRHPQRSRYHCCMYFGGFSGCLDSKAIVSDSLIDSANDRPEAKNIVYPYYCYELPRFLNLC
jgi:hypothetical protein